MLLSLKAIVGRYQMRATARVERDTGIRSFESGGREETEVGFQVLLEGRPVNIFRLYSVHSVSQSM
jgi:hypothetical protein